jgi:hypothetical protein
MLKQSVYLATSVFSMISTETQTNDRSWTTQVLKSEVRYEMLKYRSHITRVRNSLINSMQLATA